MRIVLLAVENDLTSRLVPEDAEVLAFPSLASFQRSKAIVQDFSPDIVVCSPQIATQLNPQTDRNVSTLSAALREEAQLLRSKLNKRHRDILSLLHCGLQNREIATQLSLSARTVKAYISQLFMIFDVSNRTELVARVDDLRILETAPEPFVPNVTPIRPLEGFSRPVAPQSLGAAV